ncbi:MAG: VOC family protein [Candidatus Tectomicrobia bacterium]|nr:VOC family protein [Candidatus Tectomicrobia bacterium]
MIKKIQYFSVAVADLDAAIKEYEERLGLKQMTPIRDTHWGFRNTMMGNGTEAFIELIEPTDPNSALARLMRDRTTPMNPKGEGIYLVGVEVDNLEESIKQVREKGGRVTQEPESPNAAWVHPLSLHYTLLELQRARNEEA